jgi:3',5'-nucleoside bisphosphate phosphatase
MKYADLHVHTVFSDGTYTPQELVSRALKARLAAVSVVDHDTVDGIPFLLEEARGHDLEIIPGIELSAEYEGLEVHILGYFIDYRNPVLLKALIELQRIRCERIYKIADKLKGVGVTLDPSRVFAIAGNGTVGRMHVARAMVEAGSVPTVSIAFQKFIGDGRPAHVLGFKHTPSEVVSLIKQSGGIPVLAHPYILRKDDIIAQLLLQGIMGIEVYYPEHSQGMTNYYLEYARHNGLLVTGGSDCHGAAKPDIKIGSVKIPYELVEKMKESCQRINVSKCHERRS